MLLQILSYLILSTLWHVVLQNAMSRLESNQRVVLRENINSIIKNRDLIFNIIVVLLSENIENGMEKTKEEIDSLKKQYQTLRQDLDDREKVLKLDLEGLKNETGKNDHLE